jgi:hypothetical protein
MARSQKRKVENYTHPEEKRVNNPPVGLVTPETDRDAGKKAYAYDPHLDPTLHWAGKAERTSFEIPTVSLHVHERIDPRSVIEAVRKKNGADFVQGSLFSRLEENPPLREALEFYKHKHNWSNRLIAGDSLLVMNSLVQKEGMAGKVQMVYIDPPYGISYRSNFQPFVNKRDVKDGKDEDLTAEPEMVKAFRDTWELGIHSSADRAAAAVRRLIMANDPALCGPPRSVPATSITAPRTASRTRSSISCAGSRARPETPIWEPAVGDGPTVASLKRRGHPVLITEIEPRYTSEL